MKQDTQNGMKVENANQTRCKCVTISKGGMKITADVNANN